MDSAKETIKTVVIAILLALTFRSLAFEPFHIPSGSMKPTLLIGDYLFVSKYSYGYSRFSFPLSLPLFEGRIWADTPQRGDIVVFRPPHLPRVDFIKRVIGLPGDTVQMKEGRLYLNGRLVPQKRTEDFVDDDNPTRLKRVARFIETLPNGVSYEVLDAVANSATDNTRLFTVPEGHYFMVGDNRDNSQDSRAVGGFTFVPLDHIIGRAEAIFFSIGDGANFWQIWNWPTSMRTSRLLVDIEP